MNSNAIIKVTIFVLVLVAAIYIGNTFLVLVLKKPIEEVPAIAQMIVHGITLGIIFAVGKRYFIK